MSFTKRDWIWFIIMLPLLVVLVALQSSRLSLANALQEAKDKATFNGDIRELYEQTNACDEFVRKRARGAVMLERDEVSGRRYFSFEY